MQHNTTEIEVVTPEDQLVGEVTGKQTTTRVQVRNNSLKAMVARNQISMAQAAAGYRFEKLLSDMASTGGGAIDLEAVRVDTSGKGGPFNDVVMSAFQEIGRLLKPGENNKPPILDSNEYKILVYKLGPEGLNTEQVRKRFGWGSRNTVSDLFGDGLTKLAKHWGHENSS